MLSLRMVDLAGDSGWRWLLTDDDTGAALADHTVALDPAAPELEAFADLYGYLRRNAVPDRRVASEISLVASVGAWIGRDVLGSRVGRTITDAAPVTVHQKQGRLTAFLRDGVSDRNAAQFFDVGVIWTESTLTPLPEHAVLLLRMLCCLEDGDRWSLIVEGRQVLAEIVRLRSTSSPPNMTPDARFIAICHHNLGIDPAVSAPNQLAAALIFRLIGMAHPTESSLRSLA